MKSIACVCGLLIASAVASAEDAKPSTIETVLDCTRQPAPSIGASKRRYRITGACKKVLISGRSNTVTIDSAERVEITGKGNTVSIDKADAIVTSGSQNHVTYRKLGVKSPEPIVTTTGKANDMMVSAPLAASEASKLEAALSGAKVMYPPTAKPGITDCGKSLANTVEGSNGTYGFKGACVSVFVRGNGNAVTIASVMKVQIEGDGNTVIVEALDELYVPGNSNTIKWKKAAKAGNPSVEATGKGNAIVHAK